MEKVFLLGENTDKNELSPNGIYAVNFYTLGIPHTVIIDDWLPLRHWYTGGLRTMFAGIGPDQALWAPLLEKAFAKYHGNYEHLAGGNFMYAVRTLSGAPYLHVRHRYSANTADSVWATLTEMDGGDHIIGAGTP